MKELQIHRYEAGVNDPSTESLKILAAVLDVSTDYLLDMTDEPRGHYINENPDANEQDILNAYRRHGWAGIVRLGADRLIDKEVYTLDPDAEPDINKPH
jgi:transcriptional regulator with XRE-family HTH domain